MSKEYESDLQYIGYIVKEINFESNENFDINTKSIPLSFDITKNTIFNKNEMKVELTVDIFKDCKSNDFPFSMKLIVMGIFLTKNNLPIENYEPNAIAILYPYIRSIVSVYTSAVNVPQLNLPLININRYLENSNNKKS